jgi:hypothetical protein
MKDVAMMQVGAVARLLAGNIRPVLNVQASELPTQTNGQPWRAKVPPQMQGVIIINGTGARFTVQIWEGGEGTGVGDLRVPVGAWEWVAVPACATAVGIDPTSVSGAAGGAGIIEIYGTEYHPEFAAGRLSEQTGEWWLDIVLPTAMPGRYSYTWTSPWGGTVTWVPGNFKGLTGTYWGRLRIAAGFAGAVYLEAANDPIDITIREGFVGSLSVIDYGYDIVEIGRYCEGYTVIGNIPAGWITPVGVTGLGQTNGFHRVRIGDLVTGQVVITGSHAQADTVDLGAESPGSVTLYGQNQTVVAGRGYIAAVTDTSNTTPANYASVRLGDESNLTVNLVQAQVAVLAGRQTGGTIYIGQNPNTPPSGKGISYIPTAVVPDGAQVNLGSSTQAWYGAPDVPVLIGVMPYSDFTTASTTTFFNMPGVLNPCARERTILVLNELNQSTTQEVFNPYMATLAGTYPNVSEGGTTWGSGIAAGGAMGVWSSKARSNTLLGVLAASVDSLQMGFGMGATLPTSGALYIYVVEEVDRPCLAAHHDSRA